MAISCQSKAHIIVSSYAKINEKILYRILEVWYMKVPAACIVSFKVHLKFNNNTNY